jgi:hypothetical protein
LAYYCQDDSIDVIPIAFLNKFFSVGGDPEINLANVSLKRGSVMNEYPFDSNGLFFNRLVTTWITLPSQELTLLIAPTLAVTSPFVNQKERSLPFLWVVLVVVLGSKGKKTFTLISKLPLMEPINANPVGLFLTVIQMLLLSPISYGTCSLVVRLPLDLLAQLSLMV